MVALDMMKTDDTIKELEIISKSNWRESHYIAWFSIHRLDPSGNIDSLKKQYPFKVIHLV